MIFTAPPMCHDCLFPHPAGCAMIALRGGFCGAGLGGNSRDHAMRRRLGENRLINERCSQAIVIARKPLQRLKNSVVGFRAGQAIVIARKTASYNATTASRAYYTSYALRAAHTQPCDKHVYFYRCSVVDRPISHEIKGLPCTEACTVPTTVAVQAPISQRFQLLSLHGLEKGGF